MNKTGSFAEYIRQCETLIEKRRTDLTHDIPSKSRIIQANLPFDYPAKNQSKKIGALLIHGLLDCPFSMREIAEKLSEHNIHARAILLPGHGTRPADLLNITYQDWVQAVEHQVALFRNEVENIILIGYSTGGALAVHHAHHDENIRAIVLLAPAISLKKTVGLFVGLHRVKNIFKNKIKWLYRKKENDYCKYQSITLNAISEVSSLTKVVAKLCQQKKLTSKILMALSQEDETISPEAAIDFFSLQKKEGDRLILYSGQPKRDKDARITIRSSRFDALHIKDFSHASLLFTANNSHYGQAGDYPLASHAYLKKTIFGAYDAVQKKIFDLMYRLKLLKFKRSTLTYNPDFNYLSEEIAAFCLKTLNASAPKDKS